MAKASEKKEIKIVVVGDGTVGKTCLLSVFATDEFSFEHIPTIFENKTKEFTYNKKKYILDLWDTAGQENFDRLRPLSYTDVDCFLVCFSLADSDSLDNIKWKWWPELQQHKNGNEKYILVGTKMDMLEQPIDNKITPEQIKNVLAQDPTSDIATQLLPNYVQTSSLQRKNVQDPFKLAIELCFQPKVAKSCACIIS